MVILVIVSLILIPLIIFYIVSPELRFRDPEFAYSTIGGMIGVCLGGALLLKFRIDRLEFDLEKQIVINQIAEPTPKKKLYCQKCGFQNPPEYPYCGNCATPKK